MSRPVPSAIDRSVCRYVSTIIFNFWISSSYTVQWIDSTLSLSFYFDFVLNSCLNCGRVPSLLNATTAQISTPAKTKIWIPTSIPILSFSCGDKLSNHLGIADMTDLMDVDRFGRKLLTEAVIMFNYNWDLRYRSDSPSGLRALTDVDSKSDETRSDAVVHAVDLPNCQLSNTVDTSLLF